jgi:hypothetical protein
LAAFRASGVRRHSARRPHRHTVCGSCPALGISALRSSNAAAWPSSSAVRDPESPSLGFIAFAAAARCHRTAATSTRTAGGLAPEVATRNTIRWRRGHKCAPRPERLAARGLEGLRGPIDGETIVGAKGGLEPPRSDQNGPCSSAPPLAPRPTRQSRRYAGEL